MTLTEIIIYLWAGITTAYAFYEMHDLARELAEKINYKMKKRGNWENAYLYIGIVAVWPTLPFIFLYVKYTKEGARPSH